VGGNAHAAAKGFDRPRSDSYPNFLAEQMMRHRVVVLVDLDVIVDLDLSFAAVAAVGASSTKTRVKPPSPSKCRLTCWPAFLACAIAVSRLGRRTLRGTAEQPQYDAISRR
jgi:hypothetical protein